MAKQDWHSADIIAAVRKTGTNLRQLAVDNGLHKNACQQAVHKPYEKAEQVIAKQINQAPQEIWPSRYHANGSRKRGFYKKTTTTETKHKFVSCLLRLETI